MKKNIRVHLFISGRVQGVFFRDRMRSYAKKLNVTGWVRNLNDGRVEAILEGEEENVLKVIGWAKKGPLLARVDNVDVREEEYKKEFNEFEIRY
jgi:acylphosphatase